MSAVPWAIIAWAGALSVALLVPFAYDVVRRPVRPGPLWLLPALTAVIPLAPPLFQHVLVASFDGYVSGVSELVGLTQSGLAVGCLAAAGFLLSARVLRPGDPTPAASLVAPMSLYLAWALATWVLDVDVALLGPVAGLALAWGVLARVRPGRRLDAARPAFVALCMGGLVLGVASFASSMAPLAFDPFPERPDPSVLAAFGAVSAGLLVALLIAVGRPSAAVVLAAPGVLATLAPWVGWWALGRDEPVPEWVDLVGRPGAPLPVRSWSPDERPAAKAPHRAQSFAPDLSLDCCAMGECCRRLPTEAPRGVLVDRGRRFLPSWGRIGAVTKRDRARKGEPVRVVFTPEGLSIDGTGPWATPEEQHAVLSGLPHDRPLEVLADPSHTMQEVISVCASTGPDPDCVIRPHAILPEEDLPRWVDVLGEPGPGYTWKGIESKGETGVSYAPHRADQSLDCCTQGDCCWTARDGRPWGLKAFELQEGRWMRFGPPPEDPTKFLQSPQASLWTADPPTVIARAVEGGIQVGEVGPFVFGPRLHVVLKSLGGRRLRIVPDASLTMQDVVSMCASMGSDFDCDIAGGH